jgi:hypothetical protein
MANPGQELSSINFSNMIGSPLRAVIEAQAEAALSTVNFIKAVGFKQGSSTNPEAGNTGDPIYVTFKYPKELAPYQPAGPATSATAALDSGKAGAGFTGQPTVTFLPAGTGMTGTATVKTDKTIDTVTINAIGSSPAGTPTTFTVTGGGSTADATGTVTLTGGGEAPAVIQQMSLEVPILTILPIPFIRIEEFTLQFNAKIDSMESTQVDSSTSVSGNLTANQRWPGGSARLSVSASHQSKSLQGTEVKRSYALDITVRAIQDDLPRGMEKVLGILERAMREQPTSAPAPKPVAIAA